MHAASSLLSGLAVLFAAADPQSPAAPASAPVPVAQAAQRMSVPDGFRTTLFAGEPDIVQPIAFTFDDRGRMWVVECLSYPKWSEDGKGRDRVTILEDRDGDGRFDKKKVFLENGSNLSGIEVGFGGVWLNAIPNLLFVPDRDGDDAPDSEPQVVLDGWSLKCRHNVVNGLTWGPDGWLYGLNGIIAVSKLGPPGTPEADRVPLDCGVWRYHPTRKVVEAVAWGTTNPWGLDFDAYGELFITNCVIKHLFHAIPGAHFVRMYGQDLNPHVYGLMESCADYIHWAGGKWQDSRGGQGEHGKAGGGHAHVGAMIYLGDDWPDEYRGSLFTCNLHGNRVNRDGLERRGSGWAAVRKPDFLMANDTWFRGLAIKYGPDGGVFVSDWCDTGECHDYDHCDTTNGRIVKVTHGDPVKVTVPDVAALKDLELVAIHAHKNEWFVRHARRVLQERAAAGKLDPAVRPALERTVRSAADTVARLRALWSLHVTGGVPESLAKELPADRDEWLVAWGVRLAVDAGGPFPAERRAVFAQLARTHASPLVRRHLASALQRIPVADRGEIALGLVAHAEDAEDANIPPLVWYGIEPAVAADRTFATKLVVQSKFPLVRQNIARRLAAAAP